jgi:sortase A
MERINNSPVPDTFGDDEEALKNFVGIHLQGTGFPWQDEANVYIAGHRLGYPNTDSFLAFWDLDNVAEGDQIFVTDANGREYNYEVFQVLEVDPTDLFVTEPMEGRNILTLQSCTLPDYERRLIVQAELQDTRA